MSAKHQLDAIRSKKDEEEEEHMGDEKKDAYRNKKDEKEKKPRISGDGDKKVKCKYCGK